MRVENLLTREPLGVYPETPIIEAARVMRDATVRALAVCGCHGLVGILTASDIVTRSVAEVSPLALVGSIMTPFPQSLTPSDSVESALALMDQHGIDHLPVVAGEDLLGLVTRAELSVITARLPQLPRAGHLAPA